MLLQLRTNCGSGAYLRNSLTMSLVKLQRTSDRHWHTYKQYIHVLFFCPYAWTCETCLVVALALHWLEDTLSHADVSTWRRVRPPLRADFETAVSDVILVTTVTSSDLDDILQGSEDARCPFVRLTLCLNNASSRKLRHYLPHYKKEACTHNPHDTGAQFISLPE